MMYDIIKFKIITADFSKPIPKSKFPKDLDKTFMCTKDKVEDIINQYLSDPIVLSIEDFRILRIEVLSIYKVQLAPVEGYNQ